MKQTKIIMGMPVTMEILDPEADGKIFDQIFDYFRKIDEQFSPFKKSSEVSLINSGKIKKNEYSTEMLEIMSLAEMTKRQTHGYFDIFRNGRLDPSGLVKGWTINNAAKMIKKAGFKNFYLEAGGDVQLSGNNIKGKKWRVGIRNPFNRSQIIKILEMNDGGIATSGNYERGRHIFNPKTGKLTDEIASVTIVGPDIYEADRLATAVFAMGSIGLNYLLSIKKVEGYVIDKTGRAFYTTGLRKFLPS